MFSMFSSIVNNNVGLPGSVVFHSRIFPLPSEENKIFLSGLNTMLPLCLVSSPLSNGFNSYYDFYIKNKKSKCFNLNGTRWHPHSGNQLKKLQLGL